MWCLPWHRLALFLSQSWNLMDLFWDELMKSENVAQAARAIQIRITSPPHLFSYRQGFMQMLHLGVFASVSSR